MFLRPISPMIAAESGCPIEILYTGGPTLRQPSTLCDARGGFGKHGGGSGPRQKKLGTGVFDPTHQNGGRRAINDEVSGRDLHSFVLGDGNLIGPDGDDRRVLDVAGAVARNPEARRGAEEIMMTAWAAGALEPGRAAEFEEMMEANPELKARAKALKAESEACAARNREMTELCYAYLEIDIGEEDELVLSMSDEDRFAFEERLKADTDLKAVFDDIKLTADTNKYVFGQLQGEEKKAFELLMDKDPQLKARVERRISFFKSRG